jgi:hypothetical protein
MKQVVVTGDAAMQFVQRFFTQIMDFFKVSERKPLPMAE